LYNPNPSPELQKSNKRVCVAGHSTLDSAALQVLRVKLEDIAEVESVIIDEPADTICLICDPQALESPILTSARKALNSVGLDEEAIRLEIVVRTSGVQRHRVRFVSVDRFLEPENRVRINIKLEWHGETREGSAVGEAGEFIELRTAAVAAVQALEGVVGEPLNVKVVGVKQVRAFDTELTVVSMHQVSSPSQRLVGAVPGGRDPRASAAIAVLNGLNRTLGNYVNIR
jgi:hypothetical protein